VSVGRGDRRCRAAYQMRTGIPELPDFALGTPGPVLRQATKTYAAPFHVSGLA